MLSGQIDPQEAYERFGVPWKRGLLFAGPPGNGKTHTVKALANALGQPILYVRSFRRVVLDGPAQPRGDGNGDVRPGGAAASADGGPGLP